MQGGEMHGPEETITATATAPGEGALAVIRISGPRARSALRALLAPGSGPGEFIPRHLHYLRLRAASGVALDEVLAAWLPGPRSYTGGEMVEIYAHGGPSTVDGILRELYALGLKAADPGEFTLRAFLSGRLDLTQAEAVADLISSHGEASRELALAHLGGSLRRRLIPLRERLMALLRDLEAGIDFVEEDIDFLSRDDLTRGLELIRVELKTLLASAHEGRLLREGVNVVLAGAPNAGKSLLFNKLLNEERAIVSPLPGTTRDMLRESWTRRGIVFHLHDTAGVRSDVDELEAMGVERSRSAQREAQILVWIVDGGRDLCDEDRERILEMEADTGRRTIFVLNKSDLVGYDGGLLGDGLPVVRISALSGAGLDAFKDMLYETALGAEIQSLQGGRVALNRRQEARLQAIDSILGELDRERLSQMEEEVLAGRLREALAELDELSGDRVGEEVLNEIFSTFCIGK